MTLFGYEFTVKSVKKERKKTTGFSAKHWTRSEKNHLLKRHGEGIPVIVLAREMNRTVPSIHSMLYKLHGKKK